MKHLLIPGVDFQSTGQYRILVFASSDLLQPEGRSAFALNFVCNDILPKFPQDMIELVAIHPISVRRFEWTDLPSCLKQHAEMQFHGSGYHDVYGFYGIAQREGAIAVVRPDGYVGTIVHLHKPQDVLAHLRNCLVACS